jgi:tRNA-splicing ligase RtcB
MDMSLLERKDAAEWLLPVSGNMRVPGIFYGSESLLRAMDDKVLLQVKNVASLPGIQEAAYAMPDAHWGYGFPIGGVAAFDPDNGGVISAGGVGFDISCGVRTLTTSLMKEDVIRSQKLLADALFARIPAGLGKRSRAHVVLSIDEMDAMLAGGAAWAVRQGFGIAEDLMRTEECGVMSGATPYAVSFSAKHRQQDEVGTLGSGNHYLEIQYVDEVFDGETAHAFGMKKDSIVVSIHCGSRGLGHQIGTEYLRKMAVEAPIHGISLPDRELACTPINSETGRTYLGVMRAAINCALANRQVLTHEARMVFQNLFPGSNPKLLYDVSHNTCKVESHQIGTETKEIFVHRKGATRAFGPGHESLPEDLRPFGQPVIIGGSMGTSSYVMVGTATSEKRALSSSCHGAGRSMSRHEATRRWQGRELLDSLSRQGIEIRSMSYRGVAEEAPGAYKDVTEVVDSAELAGLSRKVARLLPLICIKG